MVVVVADVKPKVGLDRSKTGRAKGTPNKTTALLKDAILKAAQEVGNDGKGKDGLIGYLRLVAVHEISAFASLLGKVLPMQVTGADGGALEVTFRTVYEEVAPGE